MTPQPAIVGITRSLGATRPAVPMCSQCGFTVVDEPGKVCRTCVGVIANRDRLTRERELRRTYFFRGLIIAAIAIFAIVAAQVWP